MQLTFEGKTIDQLAIELIQAYEPPEGYYLGFSGGKDSVVIYHLAERAKVKFTPIYNVSPIDPPSIRKFIKLNYPDVIWENHAQGFWTKHFMSHGLPTRKRRWCCQIIKEGGGEGRIKILGMRKRESNTRKQYDCFMVPIHSDNAKGWLLPILNWEESDVWQYISEHDITFSALYRHGFKRIGCVLCPYAGRKDIKLEMQLFPEIVNLWKLACNRYIVERNTNPKRKPIEFKTGEEYFNWWIKR